MKNQASEIRREILSSVTMLQQIVNSLLKQMKEEKSNIDLLLNCPNNFHTDNDDKTFDAHQYSSMEGQ